MSGGNCRLCHEDIDEYEGVYYGIRHKAHVTCLIERKGWAWMVDNLPACPLQQAVSFAHHRAMIYGVLADRFEAGR